MLRVGLIGSGIFARETYIPNILANADKVALTAVLSRTAESIEQLLQLITPSCSRSNDNLSSSVQKFIGSTGEEAFFNNAKSVCDAVIIVVPIPLLGKYVERCLQSGLHVLSEKPVAVTSTDAARLISLYRTIKMTKNNILWHVAENYRFEPAVLFARSLVQKQACKPKTFMLTALRQQTPTSKYAVTTWRATPDYKGSYVLDGGIHFVAMLRSVMGCEIMNIRGLYEEHSVVEVGSFGACRMDEALGTYQIRYGAFPAGICRLDVYWDDAVLNIIQHKGVGWEVAMTGAETQKFGFGGVETEFKVWLQAISEEVEVDELSPEEALKDLLVIENMVNANANK